MTNEERIIYLEEAVERLLDRCKKLEEDYSFLMIERKTEKENDETMEIPFKAHSPGLHDYDEYITTKNRTMPDNDVEKD